MCSGVSERFSAPCVAGTSTWMTCIPLRIGTASSKCSATSSSKVADTNELPHERGRTGASLAFRSQRVDPPNEVEEDVLSILARLP